MVTRSETLAQCPSIAAPEGTVLFLIPKNNILMPRKPNNVRTKPIRISATPQIHGYLGLVLKTGLYGKTTTEAAERVLTRALEEMLKDGRVIGVEAVLKERNGRGKK